MIDEDLLHDDAVFRVGHVSAVEGRRVRISVDKLKNGPHLLYRGGLVRNVAVGSYVKILKGFTSLIAIVDGESTREDLAASAAYPRAVDSVARTLQVSLIGFIVNGQFERGIRELPLIENECFILTEAEFESVHQFVATDVPALDIGVLASEPTQGVRVGVDAIFASHIGIFGNTGSGKSYTLAKLYHELFKRFRDNANFVSKAQFVLIDFNGEYVNRTTDGRRVRHLGDRRGRTQGDVPAIDPKWTKPSAPAAAIRGRGPDLLDGPSRRDREDPGSVHRSRVLKSRFWDRKLDDATALLDSVAELVARATLNSDPSVDRQTPTILLQEISDCLGESATEQLEDLIQELRNCLKFHSKQQKYYWEGHSTPFFSDNSAWQPFLRTKVTSLDLTFEDVGDVDRIRFKLVLQYYSEIINGHANREHLGPLIQRLKTRVPDIKKLVTVSDAALAPKPLTVVSLRDVSLAMRKVIPMVLCKQLYENKKTDARASGRYLNLIIDEAHNILSTQSSRESEAWRDYRLETFEEIIKEGRKFGVFLTIASQRPHDISETIISQLHNYFLHRLVNNLDVHAIEKAVAYLDAVSFESLPILATGTCVLAGVSAQVPVVVKIGSLPDPAAPNSKTMSVATEWLHVITEGAEPT